RRRKSVRRLVHERAQRRGTGRADPARRAGAGRPAGAHHRGDPSRARLGSVAAQQDGAAPSLGLARRRQRLTPRAVAAGAAENDVVAGDRVARPALDLAQGALELIVGERLDLAAVVADEVVMVLAPGVDRLEAGRPGADVDPLYEAVLAQLL